MSTSSIKLVQKAMKIELKAIKKCLRRKDSHEAAHHRGELSILRKAEKRLIARECAEKPRRSRRGCRARLTLKTF